MEEFEEAMARVAATPEQEQQRVYVLERSTPFGLQYECVYEFWQCIDAGDTPDDAAWTALYEWDI